MSETVTIEGLKQPIVLVGLMGAGKSTIGWRLAKKTGLEFTDSDRQIEEEAGCTISEIFHARGEDYFRELERRVIETLMDRGACVLATGGGAFINEKTRASIKARGISIWLRAELDVLATRVENRDTRNRPLLEKGDKRATLAKLMEERYPIYAEADITLDSDKGHHYRTVGRIINAVKKHISHAST